MFVCACVYNSSPHTHCYYRIILHTSNMHAHVFVCGDWGLYMEQILRLNIYVTKGFHVGWGGFRYVRNVGFSKSV